MNRKVTPFPPNGEVLGAVAEETLVPDVRGHLSPAQMVERKLERLLRRVPLPAGRPGLGLRVFSQSDME